MPFLGGAFGNNFGSEVGHALEALVQNLVASGKLTPDIAQTISRELFGGQMEEPSGSESGVMPYGYEFPGYQPPGVAPWVGEYARNMMGGLPGQAPWWALPTYNEPTYQSPWEALPMRSPQQAGGFGGQVGRLGTRAPAAPAPQQRTYQQRGRGALASEPLAGRPSSGQARRIAPKPISRSIGGFGTGSPRGR